LGSGSAPREIAGPDGVAYIGAAHSPREKTARIAELGAGQQRRAAAVALRNALPEFLATAAKTSILVKFIRDRLGPSGTEGTSLAA
jgi:hypothetical protein